MMGTLHFNVQWFDLEEFVVARIVVLFQQLVFVIFWVTDVQIPQDGQKFAAGHHSPDKWLTEEAILGPVVLQYLVLHRYKFHEDDYCDVSVENDSLNTNWSPWCIPRLSS